MDVAHERQGVRMEIKRNAWPLVEVDWSECEMVFSCICGEPELFICDEPVTCDRCGRVYRLSAEFTVEEPAHT
jgi:hypothetical protein